VIFCITRVSGLRALDPKVTPGCVRPPLLALELFGPPPPVVPAVVSDRISSRPSRLVDRTMGVLTRTDFSTYHKFFRLQNYLLGRANSIERYFYQSLNQAEMYRERVQDEVYFLRGLASNLMNFSIVSHTSSVSLDFFDPKAQTNFRNSNVRLTYYHVRKLASVFPRKLSEH